mgnify:CR=1 FL=1
MFTIVKTETLRKQSETIDKLVQDCDLLETENNRIMGVVEELKQELSRLEKEQNRVFGDENSVVLNVDDDLTSVTPIVRVKQEMHDKMLQLGMINDAVPHDAIPFAMQVALLNVAYEALDQIISSFDDGSSEDE